MKSVRSSQVWHIYFMTLSVNDYFIQLPTNPLLHNAYFLTAMTVIDYVEGHYPQKIKPIILNCYPDVDAYDFSYVAS